MNEVCKSQDTGDADHDVTRLLEDAVAGCPGAADALLDTVYQELHRIAEVRARAESAKNDLSATALVSEAYLKVFAGRPVAFENRRHLYGVFAMAMREVLIDAARGRSRKKRYHIRENVPLSGLASPLPADFEDVVSLDAVLPRLERLDTRASEVVRLKCFAGMTDSQIADVTGMSERTVQREWSFARAFVCREIAKDRRDG